MTDAHGHDLDSSSDEDFVDEPNASDSSASEDEDNPAVTVSNSKGRGAARKRKRNDNLEPDSGDEAVKEEFRKAKKRQKKGKKAGEDDFIFSDDEGGEGGLIKTRRQRLEQHVEQKKRIRGVEGATADVEAIWARLSARPSGQAPGSVLTEESKEAGANKENETQQGPDEEEYITITRSYDFAGEVKTEERRVLKSSAEAKLYLQSKAAEDAAKKAAEAGDQPTDDGKRAERRPLKRRSRFDPNPLGEVRGLPEKLQLRYPRTTDEDGEPRANVSQANAFKKQAPGAVAKKDKAADKINTVDKSRMDWAGFVDKEGLAEELDEYGKAKTNFVDRRNFLARAEAKRDEGMRDARLRQQQAQQAQQVH